MLSSKESCPLYRAEEHPLQFLFTWNLRMWLHLDIRSLQMEWINLKWGDTRFGWGPWSQWLVSLWEKERAQGHTHTQKDNATWRQRQRLEQCSYQSKIARGHRKLEDTREDSSLVPSGVTSVKSTCLSLRPSFHHLSCFSLAILTGLHAAGIVKERKPLCYCLNLWRQEKRWTRVLSWMCFLGALKHPGGVGSRDWAASTPFSATATGSPDWISMSYLKLMLTMKHP